jgi:hypothetical protein
MSAAKTAFAYLWAPFSNLLWYIETVVMGTISLVVWPFDGSGEMQHACARWWCRMVAFTIGADSCTPGRGKVLQPLGSRFGDGTRYDLRGSSSLAARPWPVVGRNPSGST